MKKIIKSTLSLFGKDKPLDETSLSLSTNKSTVVRERVKRDINNIVSIPVKKTGSESAVNNNIEKRRNVRVNSSNIHYKGESIYISSRNIKTGRSSYGFLKNISSSGLGMITSDKEKIVGSTQLLNFKIGNEIFSVNGIIRNVNETEDDNLFIYGIEFESFKGDQKLALEQLIASLRLNSGKR